MMLPHYAHVMGQTSRGREDEYCICESNAPPSPVQLRGNGWKTVIAKWLLIRLGSHKQAILIYTHVLKSRRSITYDRGHDLFHATKEPSHAPDCSWEHRPRGRHRDSCYEITKRDAELPIWQNHIANAASSHAHRVEGNGVSSFDRHLHRLQMCVHSHVNA